MLYLIGIQLKLAVRRKEFYIAFYLLFRFCAVSFLSYCTEIWRYPMDLIEAMPAYVNFIAHNPNQIYGMIFLSLVPIIVPLVFLIAASSRNKTGSIRFWQLAPSGPGIFCPKLLQFIS